MSSSRSLVAALAALACVLFHGVSSAETHAVESYLDNLPAVSDLVAATDSPALAWVRNLKGRRSIWVARDAGAGARERYAYPEDDGVPISQMSVSPDGRLVVYVRGGWPNAQGEINNSLDLPDPPERALWALDTDSDAPPRRIAGGTTPPIHAPVISPDSHTVAYALGKEVWLAPLRGDGESRRIFTIRGFVSALRWSPDGRRLAFVSERGTHSFVGVFELATRALSYLEPGIDRDASPAWSRDGTRLAFIRTREEIQTYRFTPRRFAIPWSIMVAEPASGAVRTLWTAEPGLGSAFSGLASSLSSGLGPGTTSHDLLWAAGNQLIFPWEKTGSRQLYRVSLESGRAVALTSGAGEVTNASVSADGRTIVFQANRQTPERFDLWRVPVSGGEAQQLWQAGVPFDEAAAPMSDGRIAFIGETARTPRQILIQDGSQPAARALVPDAIPREFPQAAMAVPEIVRLEAEDGFMTRGLLFRPRTQGGAKHRALVWVHGGPADIALPGVSKYDARWLQAAALSGYVVLAVNYRAGIGFGVDFREVPEQGGGGASDVRDVIAAGRYLAKLPDVDAARIGVFGQSYGGYLTTAALAREPQLWAAGVSIVGVADWQMEMELDAGGEPLPFRVKQRMEYEERAFASSANAHLEQWRAPVLFVSGDDDQAGHLEAAIQLGQSLRRRGVEVEALVEPGGTHGPWTHAQLRERVRRTFAFFDTHLGR